MDTAIDALLAAGGLSARTRQQQSAASGTSGTRGAFSAVGGRHVEVTHRLAPLSAGAPAAAGHLATRSDALRSSSPIAALRGSMRVVTAEQALAGGGGWEGRGALAGMTYPRTLPPATVVAATGSAAPALTISQMHPGGSGATLLASSSSQSIAAAARGAPHAAHPTVILASAALQSGAAPSHVLASMLRQTGGGGGGSGGGGGGAPYINSGVGFSRLLASLPSSSASSTNTGGTGGGAVLAPTIFGARVSSAPPGGPLRLTTASRALCRQLGARAGVSGACQRHAHGAFCYGGGCRCTARQ